jgi:nucleoid DNA-binding protein
MATKTSTKAARPASKGEILAALSEKTGLKRKQLNDFFEQLTKLISNGLAKDPGVFALPGLVKFKLRHKPAVPAGERRNPFTGQMQMFPAKPARKVVKAFPLKALKDMV